jgi:hypothetical protein
MAEALSLISVVMQRCPFARRRKLIIEVSCADRRAWAEMELNSCVNTFVLPTGPAGRLESVGRLTNNTRPYKKLYFLRAPKSARLLVETVANPSPTCLPVR